MACILWRRTGVGKSGSLDHFIVCASHLSILDCMESRGIGRAGAPLQNGILSHLSLQHSSISGTPGHSWLLKEQGNRTIRCLMSGWRFCGSPWTPRIRLVVNSVHDLSARCACTVCNHCIPNGSAHWHWDVIWPSGERVPFICTTI